MSNYLMDGYYRETAAEARTSERAKFLQRTYALVCVAFLALIGIDALLISSGVGLDIVRQMWAAPLSFIAVLVLFIAVGIFARYLARSDSPPLVQYLGLALYVCLEAIIFLVPLLICSLVPRFHDLPMQAGLLALIVFGGLTATVLISKKDFSPMYSGLFVLLWIVVGVAIVWFVVGGAFFGLALSAVLIAIFCAIILASTSRVLHHYSTHAHVSAALELFSALASLFYYILWFMMEVTARE